MVLSNSLVSTAAGGGTSIGDNGPAANAQLVVPLGVATDSKGNVYSLDMGRNGVRRIADGSITTVAGNGIFGGAGDYGPAASAQLAAVGIASDAAGNLFFATSGDYLVPPTSGRIRELTGGIMFSVAGTGQVGSNGDGGPATNAQLKLPMGVAVDGAGNFYIADTYNYRVRKVSADKTISTIAGNGSEGYGGDNDAATSAQIGRAFRIAADAVGNVYIADFDNNVIRKVTASTGIISTIAGTGTAGFSGDGGAATSAQIDRPSALATNASGELFFFDLGNNRVRKVSNGIITTVAGNGARGYGGDNGSALSAALGRSYGLAVDSSGKIYLADVESNLIRVLTPGTVACTYTVGPLNSQLDAAGGSVTLSITTGASCAWSVSGLPSWITVSGPSTGAGPASVSLVIAANTGGARNVSLTVAGSTVSISQATAACTYLNSPTGQFFAAAGGSGTFQVSAHAGCAWTVTNAPAWVTLSGATSGSGAGTVAYQVAANAGLSRQATLSVAGAAYEIDQSASAVSGLVSTGSLAHFAAAGGWKTTFTLVNTGASDATAQLNFRQDDGSAVLLPLTLPQTGQSGMTGSTLQRTLGAGTVLPIESSGSGTTEVQGGAQLLSTGNVGGFSVFEYQSSPSTRQEAVVPLETRNAASYWLAFDNTNGYSSGLAVSNTSAQTVNVQVLIRDGSGAVVKTRSLTLASGGHTAFSLTTSYPETANLIGTLQFTTPLAGQISVLGIRVNPQGSFTSMPALVPGTITSVGSGLVNAGSIAHFASGGGYKTTFTLVNTGTFAATAKLSFYDDNGAPVTLPLSFPQTGSTGPSGPGFQQIDCGRRHAHRGERRAGKPGFRYRFGAAADRRQRERIRGVPSLALRRSAAGGGRAAGVARRDVVRNAIQQHERLPLRHSAGEHVEPGGEHRCHNPRRGNRKHNRLVAHHHASSQRPPCIFADRYHRLWIPTDDRQQRHAGILDGDAGPDQRARTAVQPERRLHVGSRSAEAVAGARERQSPDWPLSLHRVRQVAGAHCSAHLEYPPP